MTRSSISQRKPLLAFWHTALSLPPLHNGKKKMPFRIAVTTEASAFYRSGIFHLRWGFFLLLLFSFWFWTLKSKSAPYLRLDTYMKKLVLVYKQLARSKNSHCIQGTKKEKCNSFKLQYCVCLDTLSYSSYLCLLSCPFRL